MPSTLPEKGSAGRLTPAFLHTRKRSLARTWAVLVLFAWLVGCSNPHAGQISAQPVAGALRSDNLQAAASNGKLLVAASGSGGGALLTSSDAGQTWQRRDLAGPASIIDIAACPNGTFHALDFYRKVWSAGVDGLAWTANALPADFTPLAVACRTDGQVWVVGSQTTIVSSADGGKTWRSSSLKEDAMLRTVQFFDAMNGVVLGEFGLVLTTADGGVSWAKTGHIGDDFYPYAAHFDDALHGWVSGLAATVMHTGDGGKSWSRDTNNSGASLYALLRRDGRLYGFGDGGRVAVLDGDTWSALPTSVAGAPWLVAGIDAGTAGVLVAGPAGLLKTLPLSALVASGAAR